MEGGTITADLAKTGFWLNRLETSDRRDLRILNATILPNPFLDWLGANGFTF